MSERCWCWCWCRCRLRLRGGRVLLVGGKERAILTMGRD